MEVNDENKINKMKIKLTRTCPKCNGWGKERLSSIHCTIGILFDCSKCNGVKKIEEIIEMEADDDKFYIRKSLGCLFSYLVNKSKNF